MRVSLRFVVVSSLVVALLGCGKTSTAPSPVGGGTVTPDSSNHIAIPSGVMTMTGDQGVVGATTVEVNNILPKPGSKVYPGSFCNEQGGCLQFDMKFCVDSTKAVASSTTIYLSAAPGLHQNVVGYVEVDTDKSACYPLNTMWVKAPAGAPQENHSFPMIPLDQMKVIEFVSVNLLGYQPGGQRIQQTTSRYEYIDYN